MEKFYTYITYFEDNNFHSIGVTNALQRRIKLLNQLADKKVKLVYFDEYADSKSATDREVCFKQLQTNVLNIYVLENNPMLTDLIEIL